MSIPNKLSELIERLTLTMVQRTDYALLPYERLEMYAALGKTAYSENYVDRIMRIQSNTLALTRADRVRAQLSLLTAQHVLPLWEKNLMSRKLLSVTYVLNEIPIVIEQLMRQWNIYYDEDAFFVYVDRNPLDFVGLATFVEGAAQGTLLPSQVAVLQELIVGAQKVQETASSASLSFPLDPRLAEHRSVFALPLVAIPHHILQLAQGILSGTISSHSGLAQSSDVDTLLGNNLGQDEELFPAQAYDVVAAAAEALNQAIGLGPFDGEAVSPTTTDAQLFGKGAAAAAAHKAACGLFEDLYSTNQFDPIAQRVFWMWWLTEAVPISWEMEGSSLPLSGQTMPFEQTVRVTAYRYGTILFGKDDRQGSSVEP